MEDAASVDLVMSGVMMRLSHDPHKQGRWLENAVLEHGTTMSSRLNEPSETVDAACPMWLLESLLRRCVSRGN